MHLPPPSPSSNDAGTYVIVALVGLQLWSGILGGSCGYTDPLTRSPAFDPLGSACALPCSQQPGRCTAAYGDTCGAVPLPVVVNGTATGPLLVPQPMVCRPGEQPGFGSAHFDDAGEGV